MKDSTMLSKRAALATVCALLTVLAHDTRAGSRRPSAASATPACAPVGAERALGPNVVLILLDDLGYGDLDAYAPNTILTPVMDAFATESMRFTNYYGHPVCSPARAALLTGRAPESLGILDILDVLNSYRGLPAGLDLLPDHFSRAGYATGHVGKWHLGILKDEFLASRHFDRSVTYASPLALSPPGYFDPIITIDDLTTVQETGHKTEILTNYAIDFLQQHANASQPFLLNLWYFAPHAPFEPAPAWAALYPPTNVGQYGALVSTVDEQIGRVLQELDDLGITDDTIVVIASDNGGLAASHVSNGPLRGFKAMLYDGGIRVPLMIRWPGHVTAGSVNDAVVAGMDLLPTLAGLTDVDLGGALVHGEDVSDTITNGGAGSRSAPLFWEFAPRRNTGMPMTSFAVRDGALKLVARNLDVQGLAIAPELYDLDLDVGEQNDLALALPNEVARLDAAYRAWRASTGVLEVSATGVSNPANVTIQGDDTTFRFPGGRVELGAALGNSAFDFHDGPFTFRARVRIEPDRPSGASGTRPSAYLGSPATIAQKRGSWSLDVVDGRVRLVVLDDFGTRTTLTSDAPLQPWRWYDVAFTALGFAYDPSVLRLYVDGELVDENGTGALHVRSNDNPVLLGNDARLRQPFVGTIRAPKLIARWLFQSEL